MDPAVTACDDLDPAARAGRAGGGRRSAPPRAAFRVADGSWV